MADGSPKRYWKSLKERDRVEGSPPEIGTSPFTENEDSPGSPLRRRFLKLAGFSVASAAIAGCARAPVRKALTYVDHPEGSVPGRAVFYASTCGGCAAGCGILVKNRDGRPIKLEGNPEHPLSRGGLCAVGQASILGVYDSKRLRHPVANGSAASWEVVDGEIARELGRIRESGGAVRFLTGTIPSPTTRRKIQEFLGGFKDSRHVVYDALSSSAILSAHELTHGERILPRYHFDKADAIVSFDADFLGTWIAPVQFAAGYQAGRVPKGEPKAMSYHVQFESALSVTGSNADERVRIAPGELGFLMSQLAIRLARVSGKNLMVARIDLGISRASDGEKMDGLAERLWRLKEDSKQSLVVCGSQDVNHQVIANFINHILGNYGSTVDLGQPSLQRQGDDAHFEQLFGELERGEVEALFIAGVNPIYDLPGGERLKSALESVPLVVSFSERIDETSKAARFICPDHHYLESWGDSEAGSGILGVVQPAIEPLGGTRALTESLTNWMGESESAYEIVKVYWREEVFPRQAEHKSFLSFWETALQKGYAVLPQKQVPIPSPKFDKLRLSGAIDGKDQGKFSLVLYPTVGMIDGRHAHNPWLQELPDPVTKVTWDNYACLSPASAGALGVSDGDVIVLETAGTDGGAKTLELPVLVQPGQHDGVVAVALGYGREETKRFADIGYQWLDSKPSVGENGLVGINAAPLLVLKDGALRYTRESVRVRKIGKKHTLASTQNYHSLVIPEHLALPGTEKRHQIMETTLAELANEPDAGKSAHHEGELWADDHPYDGYHWGLAIDLNKCTGCSACVIACQVENNIPVVGKDEVSRYRDMHWIRIDRYYSGEADDVDVAHQPMLCQQCDNAPCETVCPVLATVHSSEGLNEQIYNRCVGTRYCANNCPYKVRRFNWFTYAREDGLENMVLNPDVTVRTRGVMEKCTFCVQRIQEAKTQAKLRGGQVEDGEIVPACQQTCPSKAIVFGDMNDPESEVSKWLADQRTYKVLEELNVSPSIGYLTLVRNRPRTTGTSGGEHGD